MNEIAVPGEFERQSAIMDSSTLAVISRQEIDVQIATAHRFPRSVKTFRSDVSDMATLSEEAAAECSYALPRDGKLIEGPSARFAEILLSAWGNCRAAARVVNDDGTFITAQGIFHDLQKNAAIAFEVRRRITNKHGKRFSDDMIGVAGNAAASIALRNAILKGIPKAVWADLWLSARKVALGEHKPLANRRAEALKLFMSYNVKPEQVFTLLGVSGVEEITTDNLMTLRGLATAFKEGETTPEQVFAPAAGMRGAIAEAPRTARDKLAEFAAEAQPAAAPEQPAAAPSSPAAGEPDPVPANDLGEAGSGSSPITDDAASAEQAGRDAFDAGTAYEDIPEKFKRYGQHKKAWQKGFKEQAAAWEAANNAGTP